MSEYLISWNDLFGDFIIAWQSLSSSQNWKPDAHFIESYDRASFWSCDFVYGCTLVEYFFESLILLLFYGLIHEFFAGSDRIKTYYVLPTVESCVA